MTYNFIRNGCECGFKRYKWEKFGRCGGSQASLAIDQLGRLFAWGRNYSGNCGQGDDAIDDERSLIELATQVGNAHNWVEAYGNEYSTYALNTVGELWGCGWGSEDCSAMGLPVGSGEGAGSEYFYYMTHATPGYLWKTFASDMYCTIGIDQAGQMYSWGDNFSYNLGAGVLLDGIFNTPIVNPTITDPVKFVDAEYTAKAIVTESNKVYMWGTDWWQAEASWDFSAQVPTEVTGLPAGYDVVDMAVSPLGCIVVLSDGSVWAAGSSYLYGDNQVAYPTGSQTFQQVTGLSARSIIKVRNTNLGSFAVTAVDDEGNILGINDSVTYYHGTASGPANPYIWGLIGVEVEGNLKFVDAMQNTHQDTYQAIDNQGYLHTWGTQYWGPHLAIGAKYSTGSPGASEDIVPSRIYIGLAEPAVESNGDPAYLNNLPLGESAYVQAVEQEEFHRPCGHWHIRLFEGAAPTFPNNCWMPSLAVNGNEVLFVAAGRHMQAESGVGCEIYFLSFDCGANDWSVVYQDNAIYAAKEPGGCALDDGIYMFANWKADAHGYRFNETFDNYALGVWVYRSSNKTIQYTEFSEPEQSLQNKVGCYETGLCAFAYEDSTGQLIVKVSTDWGATWATKKTIAPNAARLDWSLVIDKSGDIYLAYQLTSSTFAMEKSANQGTTWTTPTASQTLITDLAFLKLVKDNSYWFIFGRSGTAGAARRSSTGSSWTEITDYPSFSICAEGCNVADGKYSYAVASVEYEMDRLLYNAVSDAYLWTTYDFVDISQLSPSMSVMAGHNGRFAYSAYVMYYHPTKSVAMLLSEDRGESWRVVSTPLIWASTESEITDFQGRPARWADDFEQQSDIFEW